MGVARADFKGLEGSAAWLALVTAPRLMRARQLPWVEMNGFCAACLTANDSNALVRLLENVGGN